MIGAKRILVTAIVLLAALSFPSAIKVAHSAAVVDDVWTMVGEPLKGRVVYMASDGINLFAQSDYDCYYNPDPAGTGQWKSIGGRVGLIASDGSTLYRVTYDGVVWYNLAPAEGGAGKRPRVRWGKTSTALPVTEAGFSRHVGT